VPSISVTIAIGLSLLSIGALIYFINHIAQSIRASAILRRLTDDAKSVIDELFPEMVGDPVEDLPADSAPPEPAGAPRPVLATRAGYLQRVDEDALFSIAETGRAAVRMEVTLGHFIYPGEPLASLWLEADPSVASHG